MFSTLRAALSLISPQRRLRFVQVALLSTVVAGLEMGAALAIAVLLGLVLSPGEVPDVPVIGRVDELFPTASYDQLVAGTCIAFGVLFVVRAAVFLFQQYAVNRVAEVTAVQLSDRIADGYISMPYEWHLQRNSAELVRNAWDNVQQVASGVFAPLAKVVAEGVLVIGLLTILVTASPIATLAVGVVLGGTLWLTMMYVQPRLKRLGRERSDAVKDVLKQLQQGFAGVRDYKILGREETFSAAHRRARSRVARTQYVRGAMVFLPRTAVELAFLVLLLLGVVWAAGRPDTDATLATLGVFAYAGHRLQPSIQKLSTSFNNLRFAEAPVDDLREGIELLDASRASRATGDGDVAPLPLRDRLELRDVVYTYPGGDEPALRGIDLSLPRGGSLGIVGETGCGKSTLLDVICGLMAPTSGEVLVDGEPLGDRVRAWQRTLGVVHQHQFLIDDTVRRNVAFGVPDRQIDDDRVRWALDAAQLTDVVAELPDGLDTVLGERGVRFSGGQRQRVTVARALYREPQVLVLDEGTAALDNATERRLVDAVNDIGGVTKIMVAHRLSTVARCDEILLLEDGAVRARGTYDELLASSEAFRALAAGAA